MAAQKNFNYVIKKQKRCFSIDISSAGPHKVAIKNTYLNISRNLSCVLVKTLINFVKNSTKKFEAFAEWMRWRILHNYRAVNTALQYKIVNKSCSKHVSAGV
jgi:hypothetical protein